MAKAARGALATRSRACPPVRAAAVEVATPEAAPGARAAGTALAGCRAVAGRRVASAVPWAGGALGLSCWDEREEQLYQLLSFHGHARFASSQLEMYDDCCLNMCSYISNILQVSKFKTELTLSISQISFEKERGKKRSGFSLSTEENHFRDRRVHVQLRTPGRVLQSHSVCIQAYAYLLKARVERLHLAAELRVLALDFRYRVVRGLLARLSRSAVGNLLRNNENTPNIHFNSTE